MSQHNGHGIGNVSLELDDSLDMEESLLQYIDGRQHQASRKSKRIGPSASKSARREKRLVTKKYTHTEVLLEHILWYARAMFWLLLFLVFMTVAVVVATIITAVRVTPEAAGMLRGMSRNVTNMAALSTDAPGKMAEAWVNMGGDAILTHGKSILNRTHHILTRIDSDPNFNDQLFGTVTALTDRARHFLDTVTDADWARGKTHVLSLLQQADTWSTSISPDLIRDTLQNGRDLSSEATTLLQEARQAHLVDTISHAGQAATQLEDRMAQLNEITIKLPPAPARSVAGNKKQHQRPQRRQIAQR